MTLDRWCGVLAAAYPEGPRRAEVLTTLAESNDGRRMPRLRDALDVVRHGVVSRIGSTAPGTRFGRWGDAASVAVVLGLLMQAVTALVILLRAYRPPSVADYWPGAYAPFNLVTFQDWREGAVATVATIVTAAAFAAVVFGRVRLARALTGVAALGGLGIYVTERALGEYATYTSWTGRVVVAISVLVAVGMLFTSAPARAVRVVPQGWWLPATAACVAVTCSAVAYGPHPFDHGRAAVALTALLVQSGALVVVALPLLRRAPLVAGGAALATVPVLPAAAYAIESSLLYYVPGWVALVVFASATFGAVLTRAPRPD